MLLGQAAADGAEMRDPGTVYLLTNAVMPNVVKIGLTRKDDVADRVKQLDTTALPVPYEVAYAAKVPDCAKLERVLHQVFADKRVRHNREFFNADPEIARLIIDLVKIGDQPVSDPEQGISPEQRAEIEAEKERRAPRLNFQRLGLAPGAILEFIKDPNITCEVATPTKVRFRGKIMSTSSAALVVLHEMGFNWRAASGSGYWTIQGVKLSALPAPDPLEYC